MEETWKTVDTFPNYEASNLGNVRNRITGKVLRPCLTSGYNMVVLCSNGDKKHFYVHRLVCSLFIENILFKEEVNHKNGIKTDNRAENLEWVTPSENIKHSFRIGTRIPTIGSNNPTALLKEADIILIRESNESNINLATKFNVNRRTICSVRNRINWKHVA